MDILYLVDRLENLIASSRRLPLVNQIVLKERDILNIIEQMRTAIPDEIKQARRVIQEKERIIAQAQADASSLLTRAREETERAMNREGLLRKVEERSQELIQRAERKNEQLKADADAYVLETLRALKDHLTSVELDVSRTILSIDKGLESLELSASEEGIDEYEEDYEDDEEEFLAVGEASPPEMPSAVPVHQVPRRASLANDTMGAPMPIYPQAQLQPQASLSSQGSAGGGGVPARGTYPQNPSLGQPGQQPGPSQGLPASVFLPDEQPFFQEKPPGF